MAQGSLIPKNGAVVAAGITADYNNFEIESKQAVEDVTPYGTNTCAKHTGSGTPAFTVNIGAFALAHAAGTPLALPVLGATGAAATFTLDTGVTETGTFITESIKVTHGRMRAAVPVAMVLQNGGDVTEAWIAS